MGTEIGSLIIRIGADVSGLAGDLNQAESKLSAAAGNMRSAGLKMSAGVTAPILGMGAASIVAATNLNSSMANVQTLLANTADGGTARIGELTESVQALSVETGKSTEDLAGGLYQVISAFGDTADTVAILDINARAAAAGLATTEEAIALTSAVTKGWGDTSEEAVAKASDLAFMAVNLGQTTFPELASSIGRVTGMSESLGVSQEELFAVMATATGVTGGAAEVSTQLAGIYASLMAPTGDLAGLYEEMGVASGAALIEQEGLQGAIASIVSAAEATGQPLQKYLGSIEGQRLALALTGAQSDSYVDKLAAMNDAAGATASAFDAQTQGVNATGFQMEQLKNQVSVIAQDLGGALVPALGAALEAMTPLISTVAGWAAKFTELDPAQQRVILGVTAAAAAIGPLMIGLGSMLSIITALGPVVGALATGVGLLLSPVGLLAAGVGGLVAVLFNWGGANDKVAATLEGWGLEGVANWVRSLHEGVSDLTSTMAEFFSGSMTFSEFFEAVIPDWIATLFDWAWPILGPVGWVTKLMVWAWPRLSKPSWLDNLLNFRWPGWPERPGWLGGGRDDETEGNARGTSYWRGGPTWVGEEGPELVNLPRGAAVYDAQTSAAMAGAGVTVNVYANVANGLDMHELARKVAREIGRR